MGLRGWYKGWCAAVVLFLGAGVWTPGIAWGAGPGWMPGFPMRVGSNVMLMWAPYPGAEAYNLYRGEKAGGPQQKIGTPTANNFMDMTASQDKTYYYVVKALVGGKEGDPSQEIVLKGIEPMKAPKGLSHLLAGKDKVSLRWDSDPKASFYNLYRADKADGEYKLVSSVQDAKFTDTVQVGKTYYYKATSVSPGSVESPRSDVYKVAVVEEVQATPQAVILFVEKPVKYVEYFEGEDKQGLASPGEADIDSRGNVYVMDGRGFVQQMNSKGEFLKFFGQVPQGVSPDAWGRGTGLWIDRMTDLVYICYGATNFVRTFDQEGKVVRELKVPKPDSKIAPNREYDPSPGDAAIGIDGKLWVLSGQYFVLMAFDKEGKLVKTYGLGRDHPDRKQGDRNLSLPSRIAVSPKSGNIFVVEPVAARVTVLDKEGNYLSAFGGLGVGPGNFAIVGPIFVDNNGTFYIGDTNLERVQAFDETGKYLYTFINPADKGREKWRMFTYISGIAVNGDSLLVSSLMKGRVNVYQVLK